MSPCREKQAVHARAGAPWALLFWGLILIWGCCFATVAMAAEQRPSEGIQPPLLSPAPLSPAPPFAPSLEPSSAFESRTYQRTPAKVLTPPSTSPAPPAASRPEERRGKYSNPYDRSVPLQGDTHKGYAPARRDAFKR